MILKKKTHRELIIVLNGDAVCFLWGMNLTHKSYVQDFVLRDAK
jgi:hypothetical protein